MTALGDRLKSKVDGDTLPTPTIELSPAVTPTETTAKPKKLGSSSVWRIFWPNTTTSTSTDRKILVTEIAVFFSLWLLMPHIIPSPVKVYDSLMHLITEQGLIGELWTSLVLNLQAVGLASVISLSFSYLATIPIVNPVATALGKLRAVSLIGLSFVLVLYLGGGHPLKLALMTFGISVFFTTSMLDVVRQVPQDKLDYVRTLRAGEWRVLWEAKVLGTLGQAFDIMRQNAAMGWLMLPMVEGLVRSEGGIGTMLLNQEKHFSLAAIFAIQFVFLIAGISQDLLIMWCKSVFAPASSLAYSREKR
jgi:NitT/TauT family transport system permease protein